QSLPRLAGWGRAHFRDCRAGGTDHVGYRDARVGLWRPAVHGASAAAAPVVATLVASHATRHLATGVVHRPRSLVGPHTSRVPVRSPCNARSSVFIRMPRRIGWRTWNVGTSSTSATHHPGSSAPGSFRLRDAVAVSG